MAILSNVTHVLNSVRRAKGRPEFRAAAPADWLPWPYIDSLFDFTQIMQQPIAKFPSGLRVAVIGAGAAGMCAAYELLRGGATPFVYEATNRIGGRAWSAPFHDGSYPANCFAELGSMRVPPSQKTFTTYASRFNMQPSPNPFPDPGKVQTRLYYQNKAYDWTAGQPPPGIFQQLANDFNDFISPFHDALIPPLQSGDYTTAARVWQSLIDRYKDVSFYQAVVEGIPWWNTEDLNAFGALGVGSGGFGPLYEVGMLEMLRIILLGWEDDQQLYTNGMSYLEQAFYQAPVGPGGGSLQSLGLVMLNTPVTALAYNPQSQRPIVCFSSSSAVEFDAVIVATTTRAMQNLGLTLPYMAGSYGPIDLLQQPAKVALRDLHMTSSSKLFIRTATKFWQGKASNFPQNIQTDELPRGIYALDYPATNNGVVLISYTWEDDSIRLQALDPVTRYKLLLQNLAQAAPEWYPYMNPVNGEILTVDWQSEDYQYGAFKLDYPGSEPACQAAYFQYQSCLTPQIDRGIYLAGDGVSWSGGWTEGALQTALNAVTAVAWRCKAGLPSYNALQQNATLYNYDTGVTNTAAVKGR